MITDKFKIKQFGDRIICIGGIGKMFYQDGFPVSIAVTKLKEKGIEVSILHVADECLKNGWSPETTIKKLSEDFNDDKSIEFNKDILVKFCNSSYEDQREIIFQYLFGTSSKDVISGKATNARKIADLILFNEILRIQHTKEL